MPQTLSFNLVHVVFSTKGRLPMIPDGLTTELHAYLAGTALKLGCASVRVGGIADHVHLAMRVPPTRAVARVVCEIKTGSSAWMKRKGAMQFSWQRGYALFSVGPADFDALARYIDNQKAHHAKRDFRVEMRAFCEKYHVELDERYCWD